MGLRYSIWLWLLPLLACGPDVPPPRTALYHWTTRLDLPDSLLRRDAVERVYIKVFDVDRTDGRPAPSAALLTDRDSLPVEAVPVVFITNAVFAQPHDGLGADVVALLRRRFPYPFPELQIDCDWTAGTRAAYFAFLRELRALVGADVSCTVRLHQYRDRDRQGVPPVDRAVLMAYNTGDLDRWATENSIYAPAAAAAYLDGQPPYPLPLDLAVAAYDWAAVYRREALVYLINAPELAELGDTTRFTRLAPDRYAVARSTYYGGLYLYAGDRLRLEAIGRERAVAAGADLWARVANAGSRYLIYYHAGSRQWR